MTAHLHLTDEYEKVHISARGFAGSKRAGREAYFSLTIMQNIPGAQGNDVIIFVNFKDRQVFAQKLYDTIMSLPDPSLEKKQTSGRAAQ